MSTPNTGHELPPHRAAQPYIAPLALCALTIGLLIPLGFCIWTLDRGFDITDEAYTLLLAMHPDRFRIFVSAAHWVTSLLWTITGNLTEYRAIGLVLILASSAVLGSGSIAFATRLGAPLRDNRAAPIAVIVTGMALGLHWVTYGVSVFFDPFYNLVAIAGSYCAVGVTLFALVQSKTSRAAGLHFLAGACLSAVFICKFPTGIDVFILCAAIIVIFASSVSARVIGIVAMATAMIAAIILITLSRTPIPAAIENFRLGLGFYSGALPEPIIARLLRNAGELLTQWFSTALAFAAPLACFILYAFRPYRPIALLGIGALLFLLGTGNYLVAGLDRVDLQVKPLVAITSIFLLATIPVWTSSTKFMALIGALFALPYAIAIGTANALPPQILVSLAPWAVMMALVSLARPTPFYDTLPGLSLCIIFVALSAVQISSANFSPAYHLNRSLAEQDAPMRIGAIGAVRLDPDMQRFFTDIDSASKRCAIKPAAPFLGLYNIPGVAVAMQGVPVMTPWLIDAQQAEPWLRATPKESLRVATIGLQLKADGTPPKLPPSLGTFPENYHLCGEALFPYQSQRIQIWAPH